MAESHPIPTGPRFQNLTGQTFGYLKVVSFAGKNKFGNCRWNCVCLTCGQEKAVYIGFLKSRKQSDGPCDCRKPGVRATPEYRAWKSMKGRCTNQKLKAFPGYGGRGIKVCDIWLKSFTAFLAHVGLRPSPVHELDRFPDNNGNYEPGNVRWATRQEQSRNRRNNTVLKHDGKSLLLVEWAQLTGLGRATIMARIRRGWSVAEALTITIL